MRSLSGQRYLDPGNIWKVSFNDLFFIYYWSASKEYKKLQYILIRMVDLLWNVSFNDVYFRSTILEQCQNYSTAGIHSNDWPWNLIKNLILLGHRLILHQREGDFYLRVYNPRSKCPEQDERKIFHQAENRYITFIHDWIIIFLSYPGIYLINHCRYSHRSVALKINIWLEVFMMTESFK